MNKAAINRNLMPTNCQTYDINLSDLGQTDFLKLLNNAAEEAALYAIHHNEPGSFEHEPYGTVDVVIDSIEKDATVVFHDISEFNNPSRSLKIYLTAPTIQKLAE